MGGTSHAFPQVSDKPDPKCGTSYSPCFHEDGSYDIPNTLKAFLPTLRSTLDRYNARSPAQRNALHEHIYREARVTFHPDKWVKRIDEIYQEATARKNHELKMKREVFPHIENAARKMQQKRDAPNPLPRPQARGLMHSLSSLWGSIRRTFGF